MSARILLVDDHKMVREGLKGLLARHGDFDVIGEASDGASALRLSVELSPDVVVLDLTMPGINGIEACSEILQACPKTRVVMLSMHGDRRFVTEALRSGALAYVLKDSAFDELVFALRSVLSGQVFLSAPVANLVVRDYLRRLDSPETEDSGPLSARESQVLRLIADGKTTKEVAALLGVSIKTVETHRKQIMDRLGLHSVAELTKYAIRQGISEL
jgi:DNA-binding NarL/FixJ family response regulator